MKKLLTIAAFLHIALATSAHAVVIEYEVAELGGNAFRYDYTVTNDGSITENLDLFDIYFDTSLYDEASLTPVLSDDIAASWDGFILGSAPGLPALFDMFAFGDGLAVGESLSGFGVEFSWLGSSDSPGSQLFDVFDPSTFELLGSGRTVAPENEPPITVPEPGSIFLLLTGLGLLTSKSAMTRARF